MGRLGALLDFFTLFYPKYDGRMLESFTHGYNDPLRRHFWETYTASSMTDIIGPTAMRHRFRK